MSGKESNRPGVRKTNKKGATKGSGAVRRRGLKGKGPTPKAEDRVYHAAHKRKLEKQRRDQGRHKKEETAELVVGRNPVVECLHSKVPATSLYIAEGTKNDARLSEAVQMAHRRGIPLIEVARHELDRMTGNGMHQGIGLQIPPYKYVEVYDLITQAKDSGEPGMIVVLDNITDPRNLGAVIRSVAAFGGHGVVIPERRSASVTAVAWRTSAGTAARLPVAKATNITRALKEFQQNGYQVVGLDAGGDATLDTYDGKSPVVIVVGSEGKGISRLVRETCDSIMSIPMARWVESLNASVAAGVVLSEFARQRRTQ
ncbi:23S rRNA (guanosine(2251)-2'-O)-methyltransferase RlmB [Corynebacterium pseudotuberculosis]|uniref:23S rRNA (guanosine(2251)-2'-O)-methyltransferase RlmB n=1 Tax=Corynebacterium pseudotuberculosis TaxID=1719 RepID=UPI0007193C47|nr:23S rRNA (guanosine(2251)-2'-O)-methyltransferase RlmB [Corynebacterium pseudotuberculosis]ALP33569.1 SpoU rRNA methylase family protein [Corynebacterium pseudotuberculosis]ALR34338.1 SpoU rRNA Methylase family protein [Corynebacterium pseudotuberculosis]APX38239.1 23S rRNA (guanosine(2251)-2'-O)-methyltransferase RlmB [Corynebacterium pseudotuberculosis]AQL51867.1 23S rRNA (guanosine-2'-O-) -methyltransferase rlmB [Corynebacterium pseudotuberculosis]ATQ66098.1 SpoU rRNA methylase family pr